MACHSAHSADRIGHLHQETKVASYEVGNCVEQTILLRVCNKSGSADAGRTTSTALSNFIGAQAIASA